MPGMQAPGLGSDRNAHAEQRATRAHHLQKLDEPLHMSAQPEGAHAVSAGPPAGSRWPPRRPSTTRAPVRPSGSGPRPRAGTTRPSPLYTPEELRASIATFLASLPSREVSWIDEHLLVIADRRGNQAEPGGPASPANQATTGQALQISAKRAGQAPQDVPAAARRPPRNAPSRLLPTTFSKASKRPCARPSQARAHLAAGWVRVPACGSPATHSVRCASTA
jgi:hypothetical protein